MRKKLIILIVLLILIIIGAGLVISYNNNQNNENNIIGNNSQNNITNTSNITNNTMESNITNNDSINQDSIDSRNNGKNQINANGNKSNRISEFSAKDAMLAVNNLPSDDSDPEVTVGYPKYKDKDLGWLVPMRYKKTGKFAGSTYVESAHGPYYRGPETFKEYKEVISKNK